VALTCVPYTQIRDECCRFCEPDFRSSFAGAGQLCSRVPEPNADFTIADVAEPDGLLPTRSLAEGSHGDLTHFVVRASASDALDGQHRPTMQAVEDSYRGTTPNSNRSAINHSPRMVPMYPVLIQMHPG